MPKMGTPDMAIILGKLKKKENKPEEMPMMDEEMEDEGEDMGKMAAADEILMAIENKDAKALAEALTALIEMC